MIEIAIWFIARSLIYTHTIWDNKMNKKETIKTPSKLRQMAEKLLSKKEKGTEMSFSESENKKLIHELKVHQIELELQNDELKLAKERAEMDEKKYTELYDFSPSGYLTLSRAGEILDLNIKAADLLGKERSKLIKSSFGFFVSPDTRSDYNSFLQNVFETKLQQTCEFNLVLDNDCIKNVLANGTISSVDGKFLMALVDIEKLKQVERELVISKNKAEENDRLKSAFLANMSHEIRTPMNGILGFAELLKTLTLTVESQREFVDIIQKSGIRMLNIINDIISISRIESQQTDITIAHTNINEQVEYMYHFFRLEATQKNLYISFKNALKLNDAFILTDKEKLYAVLTNLVKNAIKFTKTGSIELGYDVKGELLEFYVKDTGPGITDKQQKNIFDRFRQGSESLTENIEGSGLGLAISKAYIEMLGGEIWVESSIGQGTTFRFTIPNHPDNEKKELLQTIVEEEIRLKKKLKILVVEDDEHSRMLFNKIIKPFAGNYYQAMNGNEAVEVCLHNPDVNLILMDIRMPGMNGYEATRQIREFNKEVVIIAQTAFALPEDREKAIEAGCNGYISKPINRLDLIALINQYLN